MPAVDKDKAIKAQLKCMTKDAQKLHKLTTKRQEAAALLKEKSKVLEESVAKDLSDKREQESRKRILSNASAENQMQKLTSALLLELMQICAEDDVPRYVMAISRILDNYQGGINTIRSNSALMAELISQLTDQMRNFDAGQKKMESRIEILIDKVFIYTNNDRDEFINRPVIFIVVCVTNCWSFLLVSWSNHFFVIFNFIISVTSLLICEPVGRSILLL